jgi:methylthioribose-1-phosphate isomerase
MTTTAQPALLADRFNTLRYDAEQRAVIVLDRRRYPFVVEYATCRSLEEVALAIETMVVQGGPPLAYVAGLGLTLVAALTAQAPAAQQREALHAAAARLRRTRRTADDLEHLLQRTLAVAESALDAGVPADDAVCDYVNGEIARGNRVARRCGAHAAALVQDGDRLLTHCYPGAALNWMLFLAKQAGRTFEVVVTETRPYLQGARLTASQARDTGLPVTLVTDAMPAHLMARGRITKLITAADRITLDGHVVNKIGTYQLAIAANYHALPFYVLGYDGPDPATPSADAVEIEERDPAELFSVAGMRTAVEGIGGYYPAFDITPPHLVSAIATDRGVFPPMLIARYFDAPDKDESYEP